MENVIKQATTNFFSLSDLGNGPLELNFRGVRLHLATDKWVGIIAIKSERTQIQFLSEVLVGRRRCQILKSLLVLDPEEGPRELG